MLHFCLYAYHIGILEIFMSLCFWDCFKISFTETEDFVNSAKQNPDVFLDHSTLLDIEQDTAMTNQGNVRLTFSVGKDQIEVKRCIKEKNIYIIPLVSSPRCGSWLPPSTPSSCMAGAGPACAQRPASPDMASGVASWHKAMSASHWLSHKHSDTCFTLSHVSHSLSSHLSLSLLCSAANKSANLVMMWLT